jgi:hypothetical protein
LRPIPIPTICPSSPDVREPIFAVISFDLLRKKRSNDAKGKC